MEVVSKSINSLIISGWLLALSINSDHVLAAKDTKDKTNTTSQTSKITKSKTTSAKRVNPKTGGAITKKKVVTVDKKIVETEEEAPATDSSGASSDSLDSSDSATQQKVDNQSSPLYVEGNYANEDNAPEETDSELSFIQNELTKQKQQIRINDKKSKGYKKLQTTTEKLSDTTERYVEEKKESEKIIKEYNEKINCLLDENNLDPACEKFKNNGKVKEVDSTSREQEYVQAPAIDPELAQEIKTNDTKNSSDSDLLLAAPVPMAGQNSRAPVIIQNFNGPAAAAPAVEEKVVSKSAAAAAATAPPAAPAPAPVLPVASFPGVDEAENQESYIVKDLDSIKKEPPFMETIRIIPYIGMRSFSGTGVNGNQTDSSFGLRIESEVVNRFILGAGFQYDTLQSRDVNNNFSYWQGYYNYFGQGGREVEYRTWSLDLIAKVILVKGERFRPYLGGAIGYNNGELSYSDNRPYSYNAVMYGDNESISTSFVTGSIVAGTDFLFTQNIGLNLEMAFIKGMSNLNDQNINYFDWDMQRLQELSQQFAEASSVSFRAGVTVSF